jgi:hypothetical protein
MKLRMVLLIGVFLFCIISVATQAQETEQVGQVQDAKRMPIVKSLFYGFDVLDIVRGLEGKIDFELSGTVTSKHIWHGIDLLDDHGATLPVGTIIFGDSGFSAKIIDVYPMSSGFEKSVERHYAGFYTGTLWQDTPLATNFTTSYYYNGKPKIGNKKGDTQEFGVTFFWPKLIAAGNGYITPSYYFDYIWASKSNSNMRNCEGFIHVFGLAYDFEIPDFLLTGNKQNFRLFGDLTYNDGFVGSAIEHDWSHAVIGISANFTKGNWSITPSLSFQKSMEDSVNTEDEIWSGINVTYRF